MKKRLKRTLALVLGASLAFGSVGCGQDDSESSEETKEVSSSEVEESDEDVDEDYQENLELILETVEELGEYRADIPNVFEEFGTYLSAASDSDEAMEELIEYDEILLALSEEVEECASAIESLPKSGESDEITDTYKAAKDYANGVVDIYSDLSEICTFMTIWLQNFDIGEEIEEIEDDGYEEMLALFETLQANLESMDSPDYMEHELNMTIKYVKQYCAVLESCKLGVKNDDPLRLRSSDYLVESVLTEYNNSIADMTTNVSEQMKLMIDLAKNRYASMETELLNNCEALLDGEKYKGYEYQIEEKELDITYTCAEKIYPMLYNHMDSVITLKAKAMQEECDVLVSVKIEGFTQKYEQTYTFGDRIQVLDVKPAITTDDIDLNSGKKAQMVVSVTDVDSGKVYLKETKDIQIMSKNDWPKTEGNERLTLYTILAWLEPESEEIKELKRIAAEYVSELDISGQGSKQIIGYQMGENDFGTQFEIVLEQVVAMQLAMSAMGVKYNMSPFTLSENNDNVQRVTPPSDTINSLSGICIETSMVIASAVQAADMNAMIVLTPGHAQVAVEIFDTGEYILVETTMIAETIPELSVEEIAPYACYLTHEQWQEFIANAEAGEEGKGDGYCYFIECNMASTLGYLPFNN